MFVWSLAKAAVRAGAIKAQYPLGEDSQPCSVLSTPLKKAKTSLKKKRKSLATFLESSTTTSKDFSSAMKDSAKLITKKVDFENDFVTHLCNHSSREGV